MANFLLERDSLKGMAGVAVAEINGEYVPLFQLIDMNLDANFNTSDFKVVGSFQGQTKTNDVTLSGTFSMYMGSPIWAQLVKDFLDTGRMTYFTIHLRNDDPSVSIGVQQMSMYNCKINSVTNLAALDANADTLTQDLAFSCTGFDIVSNFNNPDTYGTNDIPSIN